MNTGESRAKYLRLLITASSPDTEIWLGDTDGHLVVKSNGTLQESLLPGDYVVEFTLGGPTYAVRLDRPRQLTEAQIRSGGTCARPVFRLLDD